MKGGDHIKTKNKEQPEESKTGCSSNRKKKVFFPRKMGWGKLVGKQTCDEMRDSLKKFQLPFSP